MTAVDLADFLLERIAEDEVVARAAASHPAPSDANAVYVTWRRDDTGWVPGATGEWVEGSALAKCWDPARVLAECEAKRRLVAFVTTEVAQTVRLVDQDLGRSISDDDQLLGLLALPYVNHPDYQQEWSV